jgi:hypothetical protein
VLDLLVGPARLWRWILSLTLCIPLILIGMGGEVSGALALLFLVGAASALAIAWEVVGLVRDGGAYHIERCPTCQVAVYVTMRGCGIDPLRVASLLVEHCTREHGVGSQL